nr:arylamine N-acetyltransferase [Bacillus benzoevorans]
MHTPEQAAIVLCKFAETFPFENLDVLNQIEAEITPEFLQEKLLQSSRGGLCYEINSLLYLILKQLKFNVSIGIGTVNKEGNWATDRTHAMVLLTMNDKKYIADGGYGNRLALYPLELDGSIVTSPAGSFRLRTVKTEKGSIALEMQNQRGDWDVHYAFDWNPEPWQELNRIKQDIHHHANSGFNKKPLIASVFRNGTQSINEERLSRKWSDGREEEMVFQTKDDFFKTIRSFYTASLTNEAEKVLKKLYHDEWNTKN